MSRYRLTSLVDRNPVNVSNDFGLRNGLLLAPSPPSTPCVRPEKRYPIEVLRSPHSFHLSEKQRKVRGPVVFTVATVSRTVNKNTKGGVSLSRYRLVSLIGFHPTDTTSSFGPPGRIVSCSRSPRTTLMSNRRIDNLSITHDIRTFLLVRETKEVSEPPRSRP